MTTIRHLRVFIAVYDELNMTAAASKLFMTQPSVSQAIKEMEKEFGLILFERLARKLYVTEAGEKVYRYARHIIKLIEEMEESLEKNAQQENLKVGANYSAGAVLIQGYIQKYQAFHPRSEIRVTVNKAPFLIEMLRKNELDLALIEEVQNETDLVQESFYDDRIVIIAAPEHPLCARKEIAAADIAGERLLLRDRGAGVRNLFEMRMNQAGLFIKPFWESTSTTALINAAKHNTGIAVVPLLLVKEHLDAGTLMELKINGLDFSRKLAIAYHKNKFLTTAMLDFMQLCRAN